eukprot:4150902-Amphidinium_carterae.1
MGSELRRSSGRSDRTTQNNGSNGMVERLHLELQGMFRTIRHVAWLTDRLLINQRDQKTLYQRHYQRLYQRPLVQFGECVLWKDPHKQRFNYEANWGYGVYLGRAMNSEEHLGAARTAGVVRCRTVRRRPVEDQFDQKMMLAMQGTPWDAKGRLATAIPTMGGLPPTAATATAKTNTSEETPGVAPVPDTGGAEGSCYPVGQLKTFRGWGDHGRSRDSAHGKERHMD